MKTNYNLNFDTGTDRSMSTPEMFGKLWQLVGNEKSSLIIALVVIIINSLLNLIAPFLIGDAVDKFVQTREYPGVIRYAVILLVFLQQCWCRAIFKPNSWDRWDNGCCTTCAMRCSINYRNCPLPFLIRINRAI